MRNHTVLNAIFTQHRQTPYKLQLIGKLSNAETVDLYERQYMQNYSLNYKMAYIKQSKVRSRTNKNRVSPQHTNKVNRLQYILQSISASSLIALSKKINSMGSGKYPKSRRVLL